MAKRHNEDATASGYLLTEKNYLRLEKVRDQLLLIANFITAVTQEEEDIPLQVTRSAFSQCLEGFADQIDVALTTTEWRRRANRRLG
ncbi:XAC0095 family protein [Dyella mobilis]|uniref:XAC0095-like domain-containing protein n=1 Tax=Dyella mobilis TaxID=1849582 RepID=A0ABS2KCX9_9GAMM|nr:hypothetical protein [Dyella mobilis]MBM7128622.1 hypothetical protein [Dyella mobilis]GLQ99474.1 hypothetical protein GCM10007863_38940 [Dyella mobilis]